MGSIWMAAAPVLASGSAGYPPWLWPALLAFLWVTTIVVMAVVILQIAKWSLNKAPAADVPKVLAGLVGILTVLTAWLPRQLLREVRSGVPALADTSPSPIPSAEPLARSAAAADATLDGWGLPGVVSGAIVEQPGGER